MSEILVLAPVLNRPANAEPLADSFQAAATVPSRLVLIANHDDEAQIAACGCCYRVAELTRVELLIVPWTAGYGDFARKINYANGLYWGAEPFLFQAADDVAFQRGWDVEVLRVAEATGAHVVGTNDMGNRTVMRGLHSTHTLIRRSYVDDPGASLDGPGIVFSEAYGHEQVDVELVELAKHRGVWAYARRAVVKHNHPFWVDRRRLWDSTYEKGQATGQQDRALYNERSKAWKQ